MNGSDRRTDAACPRLAARDSLYTPVQVVELDLEDPGELRSPGGQAPVEPDGRVLALVRLHGHPLGLVPATGTPGDPAGLRRALVDAAHREPLSRREPPAPVDTPATVMSRARPGRVGRARTSAEPPPISAVLRCRPDSPARNGYPRLEPVVVHGQLIAPRYVGRARHLRAPVAGPARATGRRSPAGRGP